MLERGGGTRGIKSNWFEAWSHSLKNNLTLNTYARAPYCSFSFSSVFAQHSHNPLSRGKLSHSEMKGKTVYFKIPPFAFHKFHWQLFNHIYNFREGAVKRGGNSEHQCCSFFSKALNCIFLNRRWMLETDSWNNPTCCLSLLSTLLKWLHTSRRNGNKDGLWLLYCEHTHIETMQVQDVRWKMDLW